MYVNSSFEGRFVGWQPPLKKALVTAVSSFALGLWGAAASAQELSQEPRSISLQSTSLEAALLEMSEETGVSIFAPATLIRNIQVSPINGNLTIVQVIERLLEGTGLGYQVTSDGVIVVPSAPEEGTASAQDGTGPLNDTIVITGARLQNALQIDAKRTAAQIIDVITQDEIGRQPDFNVADALRRVAGVAGIREQEEAQYVSLRGLNPDFTLVTIDGGTLIGAEDAGRRVSIQSIPASMAYRTEVIKSRTAEVDGNAIGGLVNIVTRSAYDVDGRFLNASALGGYFFSDNIGVRDNEPAIRADLAFSDTFGMSEEFGIVLGGAYFRRDQDQPRSLNIRYNDDFSAPIFPIWNGIENRLERAGAFVKLEYHPSSNLLMSFSLNSFQQSEDVIRLSETLFGRQNNVVPSGSQSGVVTNVTTGVEYAEQPIDLTSYSATYNVDYAFSEGTSLNFRASYSDSEFHSSTESDITFRYNGPENGGDFSYRFEDDVNATFRFLDPDSALNNSNYRLSSVEDADFINNGTAADIELTVDHSFDNPFWRIITGLRFKNNELDVDRNSSLFVFFGSQDITLGEFGRTTNFTPRFAPGPLREVLPTPVLSFFGANIGDFRDFSSESRNTTNDFTIDESVVAGFASVRFERDRLRANAGLRAEFTDISAGGFEEVDSVFSPVNEGYNYTNILPSVGATYELRPDTLFRTVYSRAIGRPELLDLRPTRSIFTDDQGRTVFQGGDPELDPRVADNIDVSLENYFDGGQSLASISLFYKRIDDEIFTLRREGQDEIGNAAVFIQPLNAESATIAGIELNVIKNSLDFLPGFLADIGISANYTFVDAEATYLSEDGAERDAGFLLEQPDQVFNASIFYQRDALEMRLSYSWLDEYVSSIDPSDVSGDSDVQIDSYASVDVQARYRVNDHLVFLAEGRNITNETSQTLEGPGFSRGSEFTQFGAAAFVGLTLSY